MKFKDDVIVIGSGMGGLSCAGYLAKRGYSVKVFERLNIAGGYINTFNRKGYLFENSTHFITVEPYVLKMLDLHDLSILKLKDSIAAFFFNDNKILNRFNFTFEKNNIIKSLINNFNISNKEAQFIINFFNKIGDDIKRLYKVILKAPFINIYDMFTALFYSKGKENSVIKSIGNFSYKNLHRINNKNFSESLEIIKDPYLKSVLELINSLCFLLPPDKSIAVVGAFLNWAYLINPLLWIKGGTKNVINKLISNILRDNGEIKYNSEIQEIILHKNNAVGVKLVNGDEHYAKYIIANTNAISLFKNLIKNQSHYSENLNDKLNNYVSSSSIFQVYLGLPFDLKKSGFKASANMFYNNLDINKLFKKNNNVSDPGFFMLTNYSAMDLSYSPTGKSSVVIATKSDYKDWVNLDKKGYKKQKEEFQQNLISKASSLTGLPFHESEVAFSATPMTMKHYSGNINGGILGLEPSMDYRDRFYFTSEIKNLILTGADSSLGGGFNAAMYSGIIAAKKILMPGLGY